LGAASRCIVRGQRHEIHPLRQAKVTTPRGIQVPSSYFSEPGFALDQQGAAAGQKRGHAQ
jgi:hypothetical protein